MEFEISSNDRIRVAKRESNCLVGTIAVMQRLVESFNNYCCKSIPILVNFSLEDYILMLGSYHTVKVSSEI